jgi:hypothetical protein
VNKLTEQVSRNWIAAVWLIAGLALAVTAVVLVYYCDKCSADERLSLLVGYGTLILLFFLGLIVLVEIASGKIPLANLLSEVGPNGKMEAASLSRFQLLMFTFVIALSLFLVTVVNKKFPDHLPPELLTLLGISASTYAVSKGIQASSPGAQAQNGQTSGDLATSTTQDQVTGKITTTEHNRSTGQTKITVHDPTSGQTTSTIHNPTTVTTTTTVNPPPPSGA